MAAGSAWKWASAGLIVFAAAQIVHVDRSNPPVVSDLSPPPPIAELLRGSCYACHSNETQWPWYGYVAPVSWLVAHDVHEARDEMNFSTWRDYRLDERAKLLEKAVEEVTDGHMPPWYYSLVHWGTPLTDDELETLRAWVESGPG